jgi:hypothetical protein
MNKSNKKIMQEKTGLNSTKNSDLPELAKTKKLADEKKPTFAVISFETELQPGITAEEIEIRLDEI